MVDSDVAKTLDLDASGSPRKAGRRWRWLAVVVVALALLGGILWWATRPPEVAYLTAPVMRGALESRVTAVGEVAPRTQVDVGSQASGIVAAVHVETGDRVQAGQVLAELDAELLVAQVRQAEAQVRVGKASRAQAAVVRDEARLAMERTQKVGRSGVVSAEAVDMARFALARAEASYEAAVAQVAVAEAGLAVARENLDRTVLRAPIDGVVLERHVEPGQAVVSALQAATLFRIAEDLGRMVVTVDVDEADVADVHAGQGASFTVAAFPRRSFEASVAKVEPAPTASATGVVTYEAELDVDNADGALRPGMTATASIVAQVHEDTQLVPSAALRWQPDDAEPADGARVWVLRGGTPVPVDVVRVASDARSVAVVSDELADGDVVVLGLDAE